MGGLGSGWDRRRKLRVEECSTVFDLDAWGAAGLFRYPSGRIEWLNSSMEKPCLEYLIRPTDVPNCRYLYLRSLDDGEESKWKPITLLSKPQPFGGSRWHFLCPWACRRLVRRLYRPPSISFLGCRLCHQLTYRSVQEHGSQLAVLRRNPLLLDIALMGGSLYAAHYVREGAFKWQPDPIVSITELPVDPATEGLKEWELRAFVPPSNGRRSKGVPMRW